MLLLLQECVGRASDLLSINLDSIVATPLEQCTVEGMEDASGSSQKFSSLKQYEYRGVLTCYYGFVSLIATISMVLIAISMWIMLQV